MAREGLKFVVNPAVEVEETQSMFKSRYSAQAERGHPVANAEGIICRRRTLTAGGRGGASGSLCSGEKYERLSYGEHSRGLLNEENAMDGGDAIFVVRMRRRSVLDPPDGSDFRKDGHQLYDCTDARLFVSSGFAANDACTSGF